MAALVTHSATLDWTPLVKAGVKTDGIFVKVPRFGATQLVAGDFLYTPPDATLAVCSRTRCVRLFVVPEEVRIL